MDQVIENSRVDVFEIDPRFDSLRKELLELGARFSGHPSKQEPGEKAPPTIGDRLSAVARGVGHSTYGPTATHLEIMNIAEHDMQEVQEQLERYQSELSDLVRDLMKAGAPWIEGEPLYSPGEEGQEY